MKNSATTPATGNPTTIINRFREKSAKAAAIVLDVKATKAAGAKKPKVTKVAAPVVNSEIENLPSKKAENKLNELLDELKAAQAKVNAAKSPNTKKKYQKLVDTITAEMLEITKTHPTLKGLAEEAPEVIDVTENKEVAIPAEKPTADADGKVRLGDLPAGTWYSYKKGGAQYKLLKVDGVTIAAEEANGKEFVARAANYKVFIVVTEEAKA